MLPIISTGRCVKGQSLPQKINKSFVTGSSENQVLPRHLTLESLNVKSSLPLSKKNKQSASKKKQLEGIFFSFYDKMA